MKIILIPVLHGALESNLNDFSFIFSLIVKLISHLQGNAPNGEHDSLMNSNKCISYLLCSFKM